MNIEILYPEYCNLYGETGNIKLLQKALPNANFYFTELIDVPHFVEEEVSLIYIGPTTESQQEEIIKLLMPYRERIIELIEKNVVFLITGNSMELFGTKIDDIPALGIFDTYAVREKDNRHNELSLGKFGEMEIVGFKNQLSFSYGNNPNYFLEMQKGTGINKEIKLEGIHKNNFFATYLLGPILPLNPKFAKYILQCLDSQIEEVPFEEVAITAYKRRLEEFREINVMLL